MGVGNFFYMIERTPWMWNVPDFQYEWFSVNANGWKNYDHRFWPLTEPNEQKPPIDFDFTRSYRYFQTEHIEAQTNNKKTDSPGVGLSDESASLVIFLLQDRSSNA